MPTHTTHTYNETKAPKIDDDNDVNNNNNKNMYWYCVHTNKITNARKSGCAKIDVMYFFFISLR